MADWECWGETGVNWEGAGGELGILAALEGKLGTLGGELGED